MQMEVEIPAAEAEGRGLRLKLLGHFALEGGRLHEIAAKKNRALLAILALSPGVGICSVIT